MLIAVLCALSLPLLAEDSDHGQWKITNDCFDTRNIYIELDGRFAPSLVFGGGDKLVGMGFAAGAEFGLDLNGWLFGLRYTFARYAGSGGSLMGHFTHNIATLCVSKIFTKAQWGFLPEWLDMRLKLAAGWDFAFADYNFITGESFRKNDSGFLYSTGLFFEFPKVPYVTPFLGADFDFAHDKGGVFFMPTVALGLRARLGGPNKTDTELETEEEIEAVANFTPILSLEVSEGFTPDGDGVNDIAEIRLNATPVEGDSISKWQVSIVNESGTVMKNYKGRGVPPEVLGFDAASSKKIPITSLTRYPVKAKVVTKNKGVAEASAVLETGIFVVKDGERYRINVPGIMFDSYAATFDNLSAEQKKNNERIIAMVSDELKKMPEYKVIVEGHANSTSGTEEEEEKDLIPLSEARAKSVLRLLVKNGIEESRLTAVGMGGKKPLEKGGAAWLNRRVEFVLEK